MVLKEASLYTCFGLAGWVDATTGALLPAIRDSYSLSFVTVSLLFVGSLVGNLVAAFCASPLVDKIGYGKTLSLATLMGTIAPILYLTLPPFPVLVVAMGFVGLSNGMFEALVNVWISQRPKANVRLSVVHFLYGFGALSSPLAAIPFVHLGIQGPPFQYFYFVSLGLAVITCALVTVAFKLQRDPLVEMPESAAAQSIELQTLQQPGESAEISTTQPADTTISSSEKLKKVLSLKIVYVLAIFTMIYVGTEVTVGGWTSTFLIEVRNEKSNANFLVSGFWGGIALGRIVLIPVTAKIGDELACFIYLCLAIGLQILVWLVPNVIANAVTLALLGVFLGPVFPIMIGVASRKVRPRAYLTAAISFIATFGSAGMALLPLIVGLASQASSSGIRILAPILVGLLSAQAIIWTYANYDLFLAIITRRKHADENHTD